MIISLGSIFSLEASKKMNTQYIFNKYMPVIISTKPPALLPTKIQNIIGIS